MANNNINKPHHFDYKNLNDLFDVELATGDLKEKQEKHGIIPLVSAGKFRNGIVKLIAQTTESNIFPAGCITIDMFGKAFYQNKPFYSVSHGRVNILKPKKELNDFVGLYFVTVLDKSLGQYTFNKMCCKKQLEKEKIYLPLTDNNEVDYEYIINYMKSLPYGDLIKTEEVEETTT